MVKLLDISEFYAERGGGVRSYVHHKLAFAERHGHDVVVVAPGPRDAVEPRPGGRIRWIASPRMPLDARYHLLLDQAKVHAAIDAERPDLIEGSSSWTGGRFAARYPGQVPRALVFHQDPVAVYPHTLLDRFVSTERLDALCSPYWSYLRQLAASFDCTVTSGAWLGERLRAQGVPRVESVDFGVERELFAAAEASEPERAHWLARAGVGPEASLLVTVSRMHPEKRLGTLFDAVERLRARRPVGWVIFGDGPLRPWIERRAKRLGGVCLAGQLRDRAALAHALASADLLLHGSAAETYGLSVAEALCAGLRAVVPARGGAAELVDASAGAHYAPGDAEACARAADLLLHTDARAVRSEVRRGAMGRIRDIDTHLEELFARYGALARHSGAARVTL